MSPEESVCLVVAETDSPVVVSFERELQGRSLSVRHCRPSELGSLALSVDREGATIGATRVNGVLFLPHPGVTFSEPFIRADRGFVDQEVRAVWCVLTNLESIWSVNRLGPEPWFTSAEWMVWRERLEGVGIPVAPLSTGNVETGQDSMWLPYSGGAPRSFPKETSNYLGAACTRSVEVSRCVWCCENCLEGPDSVASSTTAGVLGRLGGRFVSFTLDEAERVVRTTGFPYVKEELAPVVGRVLAEDYHKIRSRR